MTKIFDIRIDDCTIIEIVQKIKELVDLNAKAIVVTANPEILLRAYYNNEFKNKIKQARLVLADGVGIIFVSKLLNRSPIKNRIAGVDLVEELVKQSAINSLSLFLIGESNNILQKATQNLRNKYPKARILGYCAGPMFFEDQKMPLFSHENNNLINKINQLKPDILLVGFGSPKQDNWLNYYLPLVNSRVGIGVGGSFDYLSGNIKRAPIIWRKLGFEWLYRIIRQPTRIKRIINAVIIFPILAILYYIKQNVLRRTN